MAPSTSSDLQRSSWSCCSFECDGSGVYRKTGSVQFGSWVLGRASSSTIPAQKTRAVIHQIEPKTHQTVSRNRGSGSQGHPSQHPPSAGTRSLVFVGAGRYRCLRGYHSENRRAQTYRVYSGLHARFHGTAAKGLGRVPAGGGCWGLRPLFQEGTSLMQPNMKFRKCSMSL